MQQGASWSGFSEHHGVSNGVGIAFVIIGTACMLLGALQHRSYVGTLPPQDVTRDVTA
jgi:hypothetical protein